MVDNDANKTAEATVEDLRKKSAIRIDYFYEPEQNIALARNKAVENAQGNYIVFIDDDEFPDSIWLLTLYRAMIQFKVDGVLGPIKPHYPQDTPKWLIRSKLCERPEHNTGTFLHWGQTRTGNVLLDRKLFEDTRNRFGREFGRTGGEDIAFFKKMIEAGRVFVWCNEAPVYETVPPERWDKYFYLRKNTRIGGLTGEQVRQRESIIQCVYSLIKSTAWITITTIILPFALLAGKHIYMRAITKLMYNVGLISGLMSCTLQRYRNE